ncbi:MAG TPA: hypothetical protein VMZ24_03160 [Patescibacteria group bacterium]|nr:hypothetical protein [Patescibacteria group bacterium]
MVIFEGVVINQQQKRLLSLAIPIVCLLLFFVLALQIATTKTPTADEGMHLLRGRVLWQTGELDLQGNHLPLSHWLIGVFLFTEPSLPDVNQLPSWSLRTPVELVQEFLWQSGANVSRVIILGRLPIILVSLLLGAMLSWWSRNKTGLVGQAIVMVLFAFSPNLLALASLATTDLVTVTMIVITLLSTWHFYQKPGVWRWLLATLALGLALSTKLSSTIILPSNFFLAYIGQRGERWWKPAFLWLSLLPVAGLVVWGVYGFEIGQVSGFPIQLPAASYVNSVLSITNRFDVGKSAYLLGERSAEGWWQYFVVAYLVKTPSITLILLLFSLIIIIWQHRWRQTAYLWFPALALFLVASYSRFNIGYRHILAIVPLTWLLIAESASFWQHKSRLRLVIFASLLLYVILALRQQPNQLAYFNEFVGGSDQGRRYLGDSNIDWGQDLHLLAEYARGLDDRPLFVSYFGASNPAYYGLDQQPLFDLEGNPTGFAPANPKPGRYAISVNHIQGATASEPDLFDWFDRQTPMDNLGYSILIYDVPADSDGAWLAHCYDPLPIFDEASAEMLVGRDDLRHVYFDCRSTWVFPTGEQPGWYLLPADVDPSSIHQIFSENLSLVYTNDKGSHHLPYQVYYWSGTDDVIESLTNNQGQVTFPDGRPAELPLEINGIAQLEGALINPPIWGSIWRTVAPTDLPLTVLLHLYGGPDSPAVGDGLGYQPLQWQPGDIVIQLLENEVDSDKYLETGLYDFITGAKFSFDPPSEDRSIARFYPASGI